MENTTAAKIINQSLAQELKSSFTEYAMSVIVSRALPDARDGLKPVHRRILYAMHHLGYGHDKPYKKSARIVGDVMGRYHPHGDSAIYDAMVRMAQTFSMRLPLIDGQGNFGSMDGDAAAAMRYTEARLSKKASLLVADIEKDTVAFEPNYDESTTEPSVLPSRLPNLLINGSEGIAVGMATRIPPHNPVEAIDLCLAYIANPSMSVAEMMMVMPGPDFPTGPILMGLDGVREAYETGRGSVPVRARHIVEQVGKAKREQLVFTSLPFQVNKAKLVQEISKLSNEGTIEGIKEVRDESDRDGIRLVVEIGRDADAERVLNQLYKHTDLMTSFPINIMAIDGGRARQMSLPDLLRAFVEHRRDVIYKRTRFDLKKTLTDAHKLVGLIAALSDLDKVIEAIRGANDQDDALARLMALKLDFSPIRELVGRLEGMDSPAIEHGSYMLSRDQAKAILDMRLARLTKLEGGRLANDLEEAAIFIDTCRDILTNRSSLDAVMIRELEEARTLVSSPRLTEIGDAPRQVRDEDLIQREDVVVVLTHSGYVKQVPVNAFRAQRRGGTGKLGMETKEEDFVSRIISTHTHAQMCIFTDRGLAFGVKVYELPRGAANARGRPIVNYLQLTKNEKIMRAIVLPDPEERDGKSLLFVTSDGHVRRNSIDDFTSVPSNGKIAMRLEDESVSVIDVLVCSDSDEIVLMSAQGMTTRFKASDVRVFNSRYSLGVTGMRLRPGDTIIAAAVVPTSEIGDDIEDVDLLTQSEDLEKRVALLTVTAGGYGKRTPVSAYRHSKRGARGVLDRPDPKRCGPIVGSLVVHPSAEVMIMTADGATIRTKASEIRACGRNSLGVRLLKLRQGDKVVAIAEVPEDDGLESATSE